MQIEANIYAFVNILL